MVVIKSAFKELNNLIGNSFSASLLSLSGTYAE